MVCLVAGHQELVGKFVLVKWQLGQLGIACSISTAFMTLPLCLKRYQIHTQKCGQDTHQSSSS